MNIRLGLCSAYSLLYGVYMPEKIIDRAVSFGVKTVSICDIDNLYGVHSFLEAAKERNIRPIIGAALTVKQKPSPDSSFQIPDYLYCFVENRAGFGRLCEILTERAKDSEKYNPLSMLCEQSAGLVLASSDDDVLSTLNGRVKRLYAVITLNNNGAVNSSRKLNIPLAFLDNSVFFEQGDFAVHRVLCAIRLLKTVGNLGQGDTADKERILHLSKVLHRFLVSWPQAVKGTEEIAALCSFDDLFNGWLFPNYDTGDISISDELRNRVYKGNALRYGELADRELVRIDYELDIIEKTGFSSYFLLIDDIVKMASLTSKGSQTCGRGSGAASIVSYGLGITNVDPLRHNLYFERFLNPFRPDPPDIDIDFAWDERDDLFNLLINKFGSDHCARVANHNMFRYRSALRETAKAYGFGDVEITETERRLFHLGDKSCTVDPVWQEIFTIATKIEGLPRGLGMHCGGLVVTPQPIRTYAPVEKSAEGYPLLAWEKEGCEAAGFVKIDLLGNRSLAVIRDVLSNLEEQGIFIDRYTWKPADNEATIQALARGDSIGVFYIESPAMRQLQKKTGRGDFEHIVIHSSIIRPAANKFINEYVRRLKGGKWLPLHSRLENILNESYGILCYQEDVSKTAIALAGFNEADADKLRKVIAKKMGGTKLAVYQDQFFEGCRNNGINEDVIQKIWEMMLSFDGYSFCKPHSASYAMVSFQSAYLRVHHPAEFIAAVLSNQGGFYRPHAYIAEARRMRLLTVGPDINISRWNYYGRGNDVVIGFMAIKGLSVSGVKVILAEREKGGDFLSLTDFSRRVRLGRDDIVSLCPAGVFDSIADGVSRPMQVRHLLKIKNEELGIRNYELFENNDSSASQKNINPCFSFFIPHSKDDLWEEYRALGFLRNFHPLALWKDDVLAVKYRVKAVNIRAYIGQNVKMVGWQVTQKDVWTKDGLTMCFLSLEDETALYETVVFPQVYDKYYRLLFDQQPLLVYGRVIDDNEAVSLEIICLEVLGKKMAGVALELPDNKRTKVK